MTTTHENFPFSVFLSFFVLFCMISEFGLAGAWANGYGKGRATHIHTLWFSLSVLALFTTIGHGTLVHKTKSSLKVVDVSVFLNHESEVKWSGRLGQRLVVLCSAATAALAVLQSW
jgi:hypothetical protein